MIGRADDARSVSRSVQLYQLLLHAYPNSFQQEYGAHMLQVFRDLSRRSYDRRGPSGMLSLWALTLLDLVRSLVEEHLQRETLMSKNTLIRLGGWAMLVGGAASALAFLIFFISEQLGPVASQMGPAQETLMVVAFFYGPIGVSLGLLALRARFGREVGGLGSSALLLGATAGTALIVIGDILQSLPQDTGFNIFAYGLVLTFASLELYGLLALQRKPQPRWNGLAAIAGAPIVLVTVLAIVIGPISGNDVPATLAYTLSVLIVVMGVALAMLGYLVQSGLAPSMSAEPSGA